MLNRHGSAKGLSLVEVTIILLVLMLLSSVLAPSIIDFVKDASTVKVKEDCEAIAVSVTRLIRDVGCIKLDAAQGCTGLNVPVRLISDGANWALSFQDDTLERQLVTNGPGYATPGPGNPLAFGRGWRGAYLSPSVGPDPWGGVYMVTDPYWIAGYWELPVAMEDDVACISAGPNGVFESRPEQGPGFGYRRAGDDMVTIISGSSR